MQDLKIADHVIQEGRALIIAINKWDIAENGSSLFQGIRGALEEGLSQLKGVPMIAVSAMTGKGLDQMMSAAFDAREAWNKRVPTGILNRWFEAAISANPPPAPGGKRIKVALHDAGAQPPADVRHFRQPHRRACPPAMRAICSTAFAAISILARYPSDQFPFVQKSVRR